MKEQGRLRSDPQAACNARTRLLPARLPLHPAITGTLNRFFPKFGAGLQRTPGELFDIMLSDPSETKRMEAASAVREHVQAADDGGKRAVFEVLASRYNAGADMLEMAIDDYRGQRDAGSLARLHAASEPTRQEILRRLASLPDGLPWVIELREQALKLARSLPDFGALDQDFIHFLSSCFNPPFLELRQLDFNASAELVARLIRYEAVHAIESWQSLRERLEPADRRCYAFFHPQLGNDPLIFVEIALTRETPASIDAILRSDRAVIQAGAANTAVFYSISNCQRGLRGIPFGGLLLKRVMDVLSRELPLLKTFVTLSPIPSLARWLDGNTPPPDSAAGRRQDGERREILARAALYLSSTTPVSGDPVARFHLGNGAAIERLNWMADTSGKALRQSRGMMVNYRYDPDRMERNRSAFASGKAPAASSDIRRLAQSAARDTAGSAWHSFNKLRYS